MNELTVLGIIPARGGSKSIPLKNIKLLAGKPLLAYTVESARKAGCIDRLVVSTDHTQVAQVARELGVDVIMRPAEFATDEAPTESGLIHAVEELAGREGFRCDIVLTLEPTSPLRTPETIAKAVEIIKSSEADTVLTVVETRECYGKINNGWFEHLFPNQSRRRQERTPLYRESSALYATKRDILMKKKSVLGKKLYALVISETEAIDINTYFDFEIAEMLIKTNLKL